VSFVSSLSDVPLCTPGSKLPHTAKILSDTARRSQQCLLSDATRRYSAAVHLTQPGVSQPKIEVLVCRIVIVLSIFQYFKCICLNYFICVDNELFEIVSSSYC